MLNNVLLHQCPKMLTLPISAYGLLLREFEERDISSVAKIAEAKDFAGFYCLASNTSSAEEIYQSAATLVCKAISLQKIDPQTNARESYKLAIEIDGVFAGYVALDDWSNAKERDIGYFINPAYQGRGIATLASALIVQKYLAATENCGAAYDIVHATAHPDNKASLKVLENLGFKRVGETEKIVRDIIEPRVMLDLPRGAFRFPSPVCVSLPMRSIVTNKNLIRKQKYNGELANV